MSSLKKTPKKEKDEQPRQATPIRAHLARAVSLQAKKNTPHPEEKKQEREARKKATPRKPQTKDNKQITLSESDAETTDDGDTAEETKEESTKGEINGKDNNETKEKEESKVDSLVLKEIKDPVVERIETTVVDIKVVKHETGESLKDKTQGEQREKALLQRYNELWEAENQLRQQVAERERQRRSKASRRIDQEYQRRISEIYEGPQSIKQESDSDEEEDNGLETRISKLEEELSQLQESIHEKERVIDSLQNTPNDILKHPIVVQTLKQLTEKQQYEEKTFTAGQKALEARLRKLQEENERLRDEKLRIEGLSEQVNTSKRQLERQALEQKKSYAGQVARAAQDMLKKMAERKRQTPQAPNTAHHVQESITQVAQEDEEHAQKDEASSQENVEEAQENAEEAQENLDTTEEHDDEGEENHEPEEQDENGNYPEEEGTEHLNSEIDPATESPEREHDAARKRRRLDDDEGGAQQFDLGDTEATDNENVGNESANGPSNVVSKAYRKLIKPYARRGLGVITACTVFGAVHVANQFAHYVPGVN